LDNADDDLQAYIFTNPVSLTLSVSGNHKISLVQNSAQAIFRNVRKQGPYFRPPSFL